MRDITLCHPRLQRIASAWMKACATEGITVAISETLRTAAEQDALYAQGLSLIHISVRDNHAKSRGREWQGKDCS